MGCLFHLNKYYQQLIILIINFYYSSKHTLKFIFMLSLTPVNHHAYLTQVTEKMLNQRDLLLKHKLFKFSVILVCPRNEKKIPRAFLSISWAWLHYQHKLRVHILPYERISCSNFLWIKILSRSSLNRASRDSRSKQYQQFQEFIGLLQEFEK